MFNANDYKHFLVVIHQDNRKTTMKFADRKKSGLVKQDVYNDVNEAVAAYKQLVASTKPANVNKIMLVGRKWIHKDNGSAEAKFTKLMVSKSGHGNYFRTVTNELNAQAA